MAKFIDLTGKKFGRLLVTERALNTCRTNWHVVCDCGTRLVVQGGNLQNGSTASCGCLQKELFSARSKLTNRKHGMTDSPTWNSWRAMIKRCEQQSSINYDKYGGRGISVCSEWHEFERFLEDMGERPPNKTLDRIDVNGNYCPENCRWATRSQQARNTTKTPRIFYSGCFYGLSDLAEMLGISTQTVRARQKNGIPLSAKKLECRK